MYDNMDGPCCIWYGIVHVCVLIIKIFFANPCVIAVVAFLDEKHFVGTGHGPLQWLSSTEL